MSKPIYIWKDDDGYHAKYQRYDGSEGELHEEKLIGMTCLVKQCLTSHERYYRPPEGVVGDPIPKEDVDWLEERAVTAYAEDHFMWTG